MSNEKIVGTVAQLISLLQKLPADATIQLEGCDCTGPWNGFVTEYGQGCYLLCRHDELPIDEDTNDD